MRKLFGIGMLVIMALVLGYFGAQADLGRQTLVTDHKGTEISGSPGTNLSSCTKKSADDVLVYETPLTGVDERDYQMGIAVRRTRLTKPSR